MKKRIMNLVLALALTVIGLAGQNITAEAKIHDTISWPVTYDGNKVTSKFTDSVTNDVLSAVMPGDTVIYKVNYSTSVPADFYLNADIVNTLEEKKLDDTDPDDISKAVDSDEAKEGAYTYVIKNGNTVIFDSELIGVGESDELLKGLKMVDGEQKFFELGRLGAGGSGSVTIEIKLDGNSQDNSYMHKLATLDVKIGAQAVPKNTVEHRPGNTRHVVYTVPGGLDIVSITDPDTPLAIVRNNPQTGDMLAPIIVCTVGLVVGIIIIGIYFTIVFKQRSRR